MLNPIVDVDGDTATARSTFCVVQQTETVPLQPIVVGRYFDRFARDADDSGGWYFTERKVDVEMVGTSRRIWRSIRPVTGAETGVHHDAQPTLEC